MSERFLFRVYNISVKDDFPSFLDTLQLSYKKIWIARSPDAYVTVTSLVTWAWLEFNSKSDMDVAKVRLDGMEWQSYKLHVVS